MIVKYMGYDIRGVSRFLCHGAPQLTVNIAAV